MLARWVLPFLFVVACADPPKQKADVPTATTEATPPPASAASAAEPEPGRKHRPYEVHNSCNDVVIVVFGEDPKGTAKKTIAPGASIEGLRNNDGNMALLLITDKDEQLARVNVTRGMKTVTVGRSCRTLDAR